VTGSYRSAKDAGALLPFRLAARILPGAYLSPRYDPLFEDGMSWRYLQKNFQAWRRFLAFDPEDIVHVGVFSGARSGSHLFISQFHFLENAFCFGEGFKFLAAGRNFRAFLLRGQFGVNSLQDKDPAQIRYLVYNLNAERWIDGTQWSPESNREKCRRWIFHFRNPLRVLLSMQAANKRKWELNESLAETVFHGFKKRLRFLNQVRQANDTQVWTLLHERFVQDPENIFDHACDFLGISERVVERKAEPREFFQEFLRSGCHPVELEGKLVCPTNGERIEGWGGAFNPLAPIDAARAFSPEVQGALPREILALSKREFGSRFHELMVSDHVHRFADIDVRDIVAMASL
jgi:hypothetical protein